MENPSSSLLAERMPGDEAGRAGADRSILPMISASLVVHLTILFAALWHAPNSSGGGAVDLEAIRVTIVSERDLAAPLAAAGSDASATKPALEQASTPADAPALPTEKAKDAPSEMTVLEPTPPPDRTVQPPEEPTKEVAIVSEKVQSESVTPPAASPAARTPLSIGGQTAGEAGASHGEITRHAREVALVIARYRPKGIGAKGKVVVEFKLSPGDGTLTDVRVTASSGNNRLDRIAVSAVEMGKYPRPPKGMNAEQLTFRIPFQFD